MKTCRVTAGETGPVLLAITKDSIFIMFMSTMFTLSKTRIRQIKEEYCHLSRCLGEILLETSILYWEHSHIVNQNLKKHQ